MECSHILEALKQPFTTNSAYMSRFQWANRMLYALMGVNVAVFAAWLYADQTKDLVLQRKLMNNATLSWFNTNAKRYWTMITSAFSHKDPFHIFFNMMSLNAFAGSLIYAGGFGVGAPHILGLYLGSALAGSAAFLYMKRPPNRVRRWGPCAQHLPSTLSVGLGASGAVMGFASVATMLSPFSKIFVLPIPVPIPMWIATAGYFAVDLFLLGKNDRVGHDAHLGGAVFGAAYYLVALRSYGGVSQLVRRLISRR